MKLSDKKHNIIELLLILMACVPLFTLWGCDSFVDVEQPNSQLTADAVFDSRSTANAAMTDIYSQMRESGILTGKLSGVSGLLGAYSDELVSYEVGSYSTVDFYNNSVLATNPLVSNMWNAAYSQIYAANAVYSKTAVSPLAVADRNQFQGEALFVRALIHFYLVNLFGSVPYITATDYTQNNSVARMPEGVVYEKIIADLEQAVTLLPEDYLSSDRARPNKFAVQALLARVYLYRGMWAEASNMASAVLNNSALYEWEENIDEVFLRGSTATIWQLATAYEGHNTDEASAFIFTAGPPTTVELSSDLMSQFTVGDLRKTHWTNGVTDGTNTWYHAYKYKQRDDTGVTMEFSVVLRLAEQYLIRAESRAKQGDLIGAKEDLNKIRHTAGLDDTTAVTQQEIVDAVLQERRLEFFTEYGHRFFDLKRNGLLDTALSGKAGWSNTDALWPLPQAELLVNPALQPQNPGY
jgi:hypothetical protein